MIILNCEQGSREWIEARLGIPTASEFKRILTPTGKLSTQRAGYIAELLAEWALGEQEDEFNTIWTERGKFLEPDALRYYAFYSDNDARNVGFCFKDGAKSVGCSPDALVDSDGGLELKCPKAAKHLMYLSDGFCPKEYMLQVQGGLWVTGRKWWDFMSYHPQLPEFVVRCELDEAIQAALDKHMPVFLEELEERKLQLKLRGVEAWNEGEFELTDREVFV